MKDVFILAIESSCDDTAAAVIKNGREVLSNVISSQTDIHTLYGGVVPEIASREHLNIINQVIERALKDAGKSLDEITAVGVTYGPGLVGSLLVGVSVAKAIAFARKIPLIGVHHIIGHISANFLQYRELEPGFICEIVSGGHTNLVRVENYGQVEVLGTTADDAAGEAFDKVARALGLPYPGGPAIERLSVRGNDKAFDFPRARVGESVYDFSFSGLKSAVLNTLNKAEMTGEKINKADVAASFQRAVIDVLVDRAFTAVENFHLSSIALCGGVASNATLRQAFQGKCKEQGIKLYCPDPILCTDNAAMIGSAAYYEYLKGNFKGYDLNAIPNLTLGGING